MPESSTTGREPVTRYEFPEKQPQFYSRLVLREYSRPRPGSSPTNDMRGSIRLPLPSQLNDSYNMNINEVSLGILGNLSNDLVESGSKMLAAGKSGLDAFVGAYASGNRQSITNVTLGAIALAPGISDMLPKLPKGLEGVGNLIGKSNINAFAQSEAGVIRNPHITSLFEGVKIKSFEFTWRLSPKSEAEAKKMNNMINYIKAFMHPAILQNSGGFALDYPFIANLQFEGLPPEITPTVGDSFISSMAVNSSTGNGAAMFRDGQPIHIDLALHFQEINIRTRESYGYSGGRSIHDFDGTAGNGSRRD